MTQQKQDTTAEQLWASAYNNLEKTESDLLKELERILNDGLEPPGGSDNPGKYGAIIEDKVRIYRQQRDSRSRTGTTTDSLIKVYDAFKPLIGTATSTCLPASLAVGGLFFVGDVSICHPFAFA
jgi:hypothetical protein